MASLNRIILIGKVSGNPESRYTEGGSPMTKFRLAVQRFIKEGQNPTFDYIDIVAWERLAELATESLKDGNTILVEGRIQNRSFDAENGEKRWVTEVVARSFRNMDKAAGIASSQAENPFDAPDDLPF